MTDKDTHLLSEAYELMLEKALTPEQIAKKAQPAGSAGKKGESLPKNSTEDKSVEKTLEKVPYTDQHPENFDKDGVDTKVEDRYVVKEDFDNVQSVIDTINTFDAEDYLLLLTGLKQRFEQDREIIGNFDVNAVINHLSGIISVLQKRTGN